MDINVKKNVDLRISDHKEIVRKELAKYRLTNQQQIDYHFKNPVMIQMQAQPMSYQPNGYHHTGNGPYRGRQSFDVPAQRSSHQVIETSASF